ncbi:proto-oncogene Mas-like [Elgaria multicarinata webbii]|uniref:proto-oncogene Mas-like n=1 Tax=Elgaria multicarinata webbii TaxID=159646 RepID=UPI002FCD1F14
MNSLSDIAASTLTGDTARGPGSAHARKGGGRSSNHGSEEVVGRAQLHRKGVRRQLGCCLSWRERVAVTAVTAPTTVSARLKQEEDQEPSANKQPNEGEKEMDVISILIATTAINSNDFTQQLLMEVIKAWEKRQNLEESPRKVPTGKNSSNPALPCLESPVTSLQQEKPDWRRMTDLTDSVMMAESTTLSSSIAGEAKHSGHEVGAAHIFEEEIMLVGIPLGFLGLLGNGIASCLFCYQAKFSRFTLYFQNIVIANITVLVNHFIYMFRIYLHWDINNFFLHIIEMLEILGYNTRFYLLTAICVERCFLIFFPVWDKHYRPQHFTAMTSGICWALSCLLTVVDNLACLPHSHSAKGEFAVNCKSIRIVRIIIDLLIFLLIMIFSTLAILIRMQTQQSSPARLDITIVVTVLLFLLTDTPIRISTLSAFWIEAIDYFILTIMIHLFDTVNCTIIPFIFLIVGRWKNPSEPIKKFLNRALQVEENMAEKSPTAQE